MQESMIAKMIQVQTATGEGLSDCATISKHRKKSSIKQGLNWFHHAGSLANDRAHKLRLIAANYLPARITTKDSSMSQTELHISE